MNRLSDRMHASSNPPFSPWQVLDEAVEGKLSCLSWCEELVGESKDCWLAAVSERMVSLFAASTNADESCAGLPTWVPVHRIVFQMPTAVHSLSWSSYFGVRRLLVGGERLFLYMLAPERSRNASPELVWKAQRYPVSGSVVRDAELSMDGRLFATAEYSSRMVRVWFFKRGVHGAYSCAQLNHDSVVVSVAWRPYLRSNAATGKVEMIHGASTRRALMTMTTGSVVHVWQESDKFEDFRMFLAATVGDQGFPLARNLKIVSSEWVTYTNRQQQFLWSHGGGKREESMHGDGSNVNQFRRDTIGRRGSVEKGIMSKSHGHKYDRKEVAVRIGPYPDIFDDSDYIVTLTDSNTIFVWIVTGIDAQPRRSLALRLWGSAISPSSGVAANLVKACCFLSYHDQPMVGGSRGHLAVVGSIPEPIRMCLIVGETGSGEFTMPHRSLWLEWDANQPLSLEGQAEYEHQGTTVESKLFDLGHSFPVVGLYRALNGGAGMRDCLSLDKGGQLKLWDCHNETGVSLCPESRINTTSVTSAAMWGGILSKVQHGALFVARQGEVEVFVSSVLPENGRTKWVELGKVEFVSQEFVTTDIHVVQGQRGLFAFLVSPQTTELKVVVADVMDTHSVTEVCHMRIDGIHGMIVDTTVSSHVALAGCDVLVSDSTNRVYAVPFDLSGNASLSGGITETVLHAPDFRILCIEALVESTRIAVLMSSVEDLAGASTMRISVYDKRAMSSSEYDLDSTVSLQNAHLRGVHQIQWVHLFGQDPLLYCADSEKITVFAQTHSLTLDDGVSRSEYLWEAVATTEVFHRRIHKFHARNNGDIVVVTDRGFVLYDHVLYFRPRAPVERVGAAEVPSLQSVSLNFAVRPIYSPAHLMAHVYAGKIKRVKGILSHLLNLLSTDRALGKLAMVKKLPHPAPETYLCNIGVDEDDVRDQFGPVFSEGGNSGSSSVNFFDATETKKTLADLVEYTSMSKLPGLNKAETTSLAAFVDAFVKIFGAKTIEDRVDDKPVGQFAGMDAHATKFLIALNMFDTEHAFSRRKAHAHKRSVQTKDIAFAAFSKSTNMLLPLCIPMDATWGRVRETGAALWLLDTTALCSLAERVARQQFLQSDRDPNACLLLYAALGKTKVVAGLFKMKKDEKKYQFFMNDFSVDRWKLAASKNAYALMKQQKYELAAAFFVLGGKVGEAARVVEKNMGDLQLALFIIRIAERTATTDSNPRLAKNWVQTHLVDFARSQKDMWLLSIAFVLMEKTSELPSVLVETVHACPNGQPSRQHNSAKGESWLSLSFGMEAELVVLFQCLDPGRPGRGTQSQAPKSATSGSIFDSFDFAPAATSSPAPPAPEEGGIFGSFDTPYISSAPTNSGGGGSSLFDSFDIPSASAPPSLKERNADDSASLANKTDIFVSAMKLYASMGMPLLALEVAAKAAIAFEQASVTCAWLTVFITHCIEKILSAYLMDAVDGNEGAGYVDLVLEILFQHIDSSIRTTIRAMYANRLLGNEAELQALCLGCTGHSPSTGLSLVAKHLACMSMLTLRNGMLLSSPCVVGFRETLLCVWRRHIEKLVDVYNRCCRMNLWDTSESSAGDDVYLKISIQNVAAFAAMAMGLKVAWHHRQIALLSDLLCPSRTGETTTIFSTLSSSMATLIDLVQNPSSRSSHPSVDIACLSHILSTLTMEELLSGLVESMKFIDGIESADTSLDMLLAHCKDDNERMLKSGSRGKLVSNTLENFVLSAFYHATIEDTCAVESFVQVVSLASKDSLLSKNEVLGRLWSALRAGPRLCPTETTDDSPSELRDDATSSVTQPEGAKLVETERSKGGTVPKSTDNAVSAIAAIPDMLASQMEALGIPSPTRKAVQSQEKGDPWEHFEIVRTSSIPVISFCFDHSDAARTFVTVASESGVYDVNIDSSLRFRPRTRDKSTLLDMDDLSWEKSRDRFWQEENDLLERNLVNLADRHRHSRGRMNVFECMSRSSFAVDALRSNGLRLTPLEQRIVNNMGGMSAGRSGTLDDFQASCVESHPRFPFYILGDGLGGVSLWMFGKNETLGIYEEQTKQIYGVKRLRFNGMGDKFCSCNAAGVVKLWQFGCHPAMLFANDGFHIKCDSATDAAFLNSGSVLAISGISTDKNVGSLQIWDSMTCENEGQICAFRPSAFDSAGCTALAYLPEEELIITGYATGNLAAFDFRERRMLDISTFGKPRKDAGAIVDITYSRELGLFATASMDGNVRIWDSHTLESIKDLGVCHDSVTRVQFSGQYLYSSGQDGRVLRHSKKGNGFIL
jgi:WD40 repeat protein